MGKLIVDLLTPEWFSHMNDLVDIAMREHLRMELERAGWKEGVELRRTFKGSPTIEYEWD